MFPRDDRPQRRDDRDLRRESTTLDNGFATLTLPRNLTKRDYSRLETWLGEVLNLISEDVSDPPKPEHPLAHVPLANSPSPLRGPRK